MAVQPTEAPMSAHELGQKPQDMTDSANAEALKAFQRYVKLGAQNYDKYDKAVRRGDKLFSGIKESKDNDIVASDNPDSPTKVNKIRRKIVGAVTQIYERNPKFIGIPKRPILVDEDAQQDPATGAMIPPPIDPATGRPKQKDISMQIAEIVAAIADHVFQESGFKAECKQMALEAHQRPASVMQVGYQFDEDNDVDDVYFRWRSFKTFIIDPTAQVYNGVVRKCRFMGVRWSLRKSEAEAMGLSWSSMTDKDAKDSDTTDDDEARSVYQVWSQERNEIAWISQNAAGFAKEPQPWPWKIDGYPFVILKFSEDIDKQFSKPLILEAEAIQNEIDEMRETMENSIVNNRKVALYDSEVISDQEVTEMVGRRKRGWKGVPNLSSRSSPPIQMFNEDTIDADFYSHYDRNEAEMDFVLGTSANEQMRMSGKTAREVEEVSKNQGTMTSGKADILIDAMNSIVRKAVQIMRQTYTEERVTQITTAEGGRYWVKWKGSEVLSEVDLRVEVGSMQREDDEVRKQVALNMFDKLSNVAGISVKRLANDVLREFGRKETEQYWEQAAPIAPQPPAPAAPPALGGSAPAPTDPRASLAGQMSPMV